MSSFLYLAALPTIGILPPSPAEPRITCGGEYGWWFQGSPCIAPKKGPRLGSQSFDHPTHTPWGDDISVSSHDFFDAWLLSTTRTAPTQHRATRLRPSRRRIVLAAATLPVVEALERTTSQLAGVFLVLVTRSSNAVGDSQFFWDYRNLDVQNYWAHEIVFAGAQSPFVDGVFTDDPPGYGQHPCNLWTPIDIRELQLGTQKAWNQPLALLTRAKKYIAQAFQMPLSFDAGVQANVTACTAWMRAMCAVLANDSAITFLGPGANSDTAANMSIAACLVARGPYSFVKPPWM